MCRECQDIDYPAAWPWIPCGSPPKRAEYDGVDLKEVIRDLADVIEGLADIVRQPRNRESEPKPYYPEAPPKDGGEMKQEGIQIID